MVDEGQRAKNIDTEAAQALRQLARLRTVVMTATPLENALGELYAHVDLAVPTLLGTEKDFQANFARPIEKHHSQAAATQLRNLIAPFFLRRRKDEVAKDLPVKTIMVHDVQLEGDQAALYESVRAAVSREVRDAIAKRGIGQSNIVILDALLKLRQVCCDPRLVKLKAAGAVKQSAKLEALLDLVRTAVSEGRRVLVFSQFTEMLDLIGAALKDVEIPYLELTGKTQDRTGVVAQFQEGQTPLMLLSLRAGGVGLNLTAADTVIHYDPWWNPAVEAQATDRAHRIGQEKPVFVYRMITKHSVEEKINVMQQRKAELAEAVLGDEKALGALRFTEDDVVELFGE